MHHVLQQRHASSVAGCIIKVCLCRGLYNKHVVPVIGGDGSAKLELGVKCLLAGPCEKTPVLCLQGNAVALSLVLHARAGTGQRADHT